MKKNQYMQQANMLGTTIELRLVGVPSDKVDILFEELWKQVREFNSRFSRFLPESELSRFNFNAGNKTLISQQFEMLLRKAKQFAIITSEVFNPFILPALQQNGYVHSMENPNNNTPVFLGRKLVSYTEIEIDEGSARIPKDTAIDFGGIGKGYLADVLGHYLKHHTEDYCLDIGGDMNISGSSTNGPWEIDVASSQDPSSVSANYTNSDTASFGIATSGTTRNRNGKRQTHIIDPRNGEIIERDKLQCTIIASDTVTADVLASCIIIGGTRFAERFMAEGLLKAMFLQDANLEKPVILGEGFTFNNEKQYAKLPTHV